MNINTIKSYPRKGRQAAKLFAKQIKKAGINIGTSKSGIDVYQKIDKDGNKILTSFRNNAILKEVTIEANSEKVYHGHYSNAIRVKHHTDCEYTRITHHYDSNDKTISINSISHYWNKDNNKPVFSNKIITRHTTQYL